MNTFIIINKGAAEMYERETLDEVAFVVGCPKDEIREAIKGRGRWDRDDGVIIVILSQPEE